MTDIEIIKEIDKYHYNFKFFDITNLISKVFFLFLTAICISGVYSGLEPTLLFVIAYALSVVSIIITWKACEYCKNRVDELLSEALNRY